MNMFSSSVVAARSVAHLPAGTCFIFYSARCAGRAGGGLQLQLQCGDARCSNCRSEQPSLGILKGKFGPSFVSSE